MGSQLTKESGSEDYLGFDDFFSSWCVGSNRKTDENQKSKIPKTSTNPQTASNYMDESNITMRSSSSPVSTPKSSSTKRRSSVELVNDAMSDGETKQKYLNSAHLDEALVTGLITPDVYAQKLKKLDSMFVEQQLLQETTSSAKELEDDEQQKFHDACSTDVPPSSPPRLNKTF